MSPTIKCFEYPMKLREIRCQRILTSTKVAEEETFGYELFVSKIPSDANEDELIPFFETIGPLHTFRLMMKYDQCVNRGHAYITYIYESDAKDAVRILNGKEIRKGHPISVARSFNNCRIFIGGIPVNKTKDEVWHELQKQGVPNIVDVIMYRSYSNRNMNRGFVFVEFPSHKFASKMRLKLRGLKLWSHEVVVDWSVPQPVVSEDEMAKHYHTRMMENPSTLLQTKEEVKIIYLRNLNVTESREDLREEIEKYINPQDVEKVYKFKDYAFIHVSTRELTLKLIECLEVHYKNTCVEVSLAKPRNHFTKPGYRKYQMLKNTPYLPKRLDDSTDSNHHRLLSSTPINLNYQKPLSHIPSQNFLHSLPISPVYSPSSPNPYDISPETNMEQFLDEDLKNPNFSFNFPAMYHFQKDVGNYPRYPEFDDFGGCAFNPRDTYTSDNGSKDLVSAIKNILIEEDTNNGYSHIMNKFNVCCSRDYFSIYQDGGYKY